MFLTTYKKKRKRAKKAWKIMSLNNELICLYNMDLIAEGIRLMLKGSILE